MPFNFILMIFSDSFSEIMKTGENTAPSQKVREKERRLNFSDKQLNHFKFAHKMPQIRWQIGEKATGQEHTPLLTCSFPVLGLSHSPKNEKH